MSFLLSFCQLEWAKDMVLYHYSSKICRDLEFFPWVIEFFSWALSFFHLEFFSKCPIFKPALIIFQKTMLHRIVKTDHCLTACRIIHVFVLKRTSECILYCRVVPWLILEPVSLHSVPKFFIMTWVDINFYLPFVTIPPFVFHFYYSALGFYSAGKSYYSLIGNNTFFAELSTQTFA